MIYNIVYTIISSVNDMLASASPDELVGIDAETMAYVCLFACIGTIVVTLAMFAVYYVFRTIGISKMSKNNGVQGYKRAIIPFYGLKMANDLAPNSKYIKKNDVLYVLAIVFGAITLASSLVVDILYGIPYMAILAQGILPTVEELNAQGIAPNALNATFQLSSLAANLFTVFVFGSVFRSYSAQRGGLFTTLTLVGFIALDMPLLGGIFLFALRDKQRVDYDRIIEERRRQAGSYNPFGGNTYGSSTYTGSFESDKKSEDVDPFEEFSDGKDCKNTNNNGDFGKSDGSDGGDGTDDLFS